MNLLTTFLLAFLYAQGAAPGPTWHGFETRRIALSGNEPATLVLPKVPAAPGRPWVLQSNLYEGPITGRMNAPALALLEKGWHMVACPLGNTYGAPSALKKWDELYGVMTGAYGLARKPVLVGVSREGLAMHRWAAFHPEQVGGIYADRAVCDFKSWPGGKLGIGKGGARGWAELIKIYGFTGEAEALAYKENPVDLAGALARAGIPLFHVAGEEDAVVPPAENVMVLRARMREAGGDLTLIVVPGAGHNPHGLEDPSPIIEFMLRCAASGAKGTTAPRF